MMKNELHLDFTDAEDIGGMFDGLDVGEVARIEVEARVVSKDEQGVNLSVEGVSLVEPAAEPLEVDDAEEVPSAVVVMGGRSTPDDDY